MTDRPSPMTGARYDTATPVASEGNAGDVAAPEAGAIGIVAALAGIPGDGCLDTVQRYARDRQHQTLLALQRTVGNAAVGRLLRPASAVAARQVVPPPAAAPSVLAPVSVQRHDPPPPGDEAARKQTYDAATPTPLTTIDDLIRLIERVEGAYPGENWQGITTKIRKAYYDDAAWDQMIKNRQGYAGVNWPPVKVEDAKALATAKGHPEIVVNGESIDMGHVFTGLDAMNFPETGGKIWLSRVEGPAGATWGGDVGSALAEWDIHAGSDRTKRADYYDRYASKDDMIGDVDGIAITGVAVAGLPGGDTLSARLRSYYLGTGGKSLRFTKFAQASGFKWTGKGSGIKLDAEARKHITSQVDNFGVAWRRKDQGAFGGAGSNWFHDEDIKWFVDRFVGWVEQGLAAENP